MTPTRPSGALPGRLAGAHLTAFTKLAELSYDRKLNGYAELWRASVADPARFWSWSGITAA